jgi:hypothetical protein
MGVSRPGDYWDKNVAVLDSKLRDSYDLYKHSVAWQGGKTVVTCFQRFCTDHLTVKTASYFPTCPHKIGHFYSFQGFWTELEKL